MFASLITGVIRVALKSIVARVSAIRPVKK